MIYRFVYNVMNNTVELAEPTINDIALLCNAWFDDRSYWRAENFPVIAEYGITREKEVFDGFVEAVGEEEARQEVLRFFEYAFERI